MPVFVALLRGVNVGSRSARVPMAELRAMLQQLGYTGVATLLNSGNAVFRARGGSAVRIAGDIAAAIARRLEAQVPVIVVSARDLDAIVADNPIDVEAGQHSRFLVAFVQDPKRLAGLSAVESLVAPPERFAVGRRAAYLLCTRGLLESRAATALLGRPGSFVTTRNWATVLKLQAIAAGAARTNTHNPGSGDG